MARAIVLCILAFGTAMATMTGGKTQLDLSDPTVAANAQTLATFAVTTYNENSNDEVYSVLVKVTNATVQVVNGLSYGLTFYVGQTDCNKAAVGSHFINTFNCPPDMEGVFHKCQVTFWQKPNNGVIQITDHACSVCPKSMAN